MATNMEAAEINSAGLDMTESRLWGGEVVMGRVAFAGGGVAATGQSPTLRTVAVKFDRREWPIARKDYIASVAQAETGKGLHAMFLAIAGVHFCQGYLTHRRSLL